MDALTARTPLDLTDYAAAALPSTPADSVVAIGLKGSRLGPVMRLDDVAAPATMAGVIAASMRPANCTRVFLIGYGPEDRALRWLELESILTGHGLSVEGLIHVDGRMCTNLGTGEAVAYAPGTSTLGLHLALLDGARAEYPTATPSESDALTEAVAAHAATLTDMHADAPALIEGINRLLKDQNDAGAAAVVLATLNHRDPEYLIAALVACTAPIRLEAVDFTRGEFPHGLRWKASVEAETVLNAAVALGPGHACAGALAVLAYVAWIRGAGAVADGRLNLAERCAPHHPHVRAVRRMTRATPVAVVATDPAWAWGKHTRAAEGR